MSSPSTDKDFDAKDAAQTNTYVAESSYAADTPVDVYADHISSTIPRKPWYKGGGLSLYVAQQPSSFAPNAKQSNADFDPTPPSNRTWGWFAFICFWASDGWAISMLEVGSSIATVTLNWELAIVALAIGYTVIAVIVALNSNPGGRYHIPFPIIARSSYGVNLSYYAVFSRAVLAIFWLGITSVQGGQAVQVLLNAIWPSFRNIPNQLPASSGMTTAGMTSYLIYFLLQLPFLCIPYHKIYWFFLAKAILAPVTFFAILGVTIGKAGGTLSNSTLLNAGNPTSGSGLAWAFLSAINATLGNNSTVGLNCSDFSRYSKKQFSSSVVLVAMPCLFTLVGTMGILMAAASRQAYGQTMWNPIDMVDTWSTSPGGRAGAAFASIGIIVAQIGINVSANSISAANDLVAMLPRFINIRRGQLLAALIGGWAFVPWEILSHAEKFISFMSSYTIFLGPMTGVMMADYFIIKRRKLDIPELYDMNGIYKYNKTGINYPALAGLLIGSIPCMPGMINYIDPSISVSVGAQRLFNLSYIYSFTISGAVHWTLNYFFPSPETLMPANTGEDRMLQYDQDKSSEA